MDSFDQNATVSQDTDTAATLPQGQAKYARIFASYGGARVTESMRLRKDADEPPTEFGKIIRLHERIKKYTNRDIGTLPDEKELIELGDSLFKTLFPPKVRRLYDIARARQRDGMLDLVFTSMVPWIAEKPWEFAYDSELKRFVATRDVNFVRNVLTSVPSDIPAPNAECLRILVVAAQPVGFVELSIKQETEVIRRGFDELVKQGLAKVDVIARATPEALQKALSTGKYSVVHFIGHGDFDEKTQEGALIFESVSRATASPHGPEAPRPLLRPGLEPDLPQRLSQRHRRPRGIQQGRRAIAGGAGASGAGRESVQRARLFSDRVREALLLVARARIVAGPCRARGAHLRQLLARRRDHRLGRSRGVRARSEPGAACRARKPSHRGGGRGRRGSAPLGKEAQVHHRCLGRDRSLPALEKTLKTMNAAQAVFAFELVDMSMPLDMSGISRASRPTVARTCGRRNSRSASTAGPRTCAWTCSPASRGIGCAATTR